MKAELYKRILETELNYIKCFSDFYEEQKVINFKDDKLRDMYMHNFIFLKELMNEDELNNFIATELKNAEKDCLEHVHIMINADIKNYDLKSIFPKIEITEYCFMAITPENFNKLKVKEDCFVFKANTSKTLADGSLVDIHANKAAMGEDFAIKRIKRKMEVYHNNLNLDLYVCYKDNKPIGNCEIFIKDGIGKIEDFDILDEYQKQGYGTSVLHTLLYESYCENLDITYLITDNSDTTKEMYKKCGFSIEGIKTSILFKL